MYFRVVAQYLFIFTLLIGMSLGASYILPVKYVWFHKNDESHRYPLSTVSQWEGVIDGWDWVSSYKMQWVFPTTLDLSVNMKTAVAKQPDNSLVAKDASVFHLRKVPEHLPIVDVTPSRLAQALVLLQDLKAHLEIESIYEYASGAVLVKTQNQQEMLFPSMDVPDKLYQVMAKMPNTGKWTCHFGHPRYASCMKQH